MKVSRMIELLQQMPQEASVYIFDGNLACSPQKPKTVYVEFENYDKDTLDDCWFDSTQDAIEEGVGFEDLAKCVILQ